MNSLSLRQKLGTLAALATLALAGCGDDRYAYGYYPIVCDSGVTEGTVETDAILDLDPGRGVGATVEYSGDGAWRELGLAEDTVLHATLVGQDEQRAYFAGDAGAFLETMDGGKSLVAVESDTRAALRGIEDLQAR